ncbi:MAG TPA: helix-turn-helix domain-containing protein [Flavipsychrobacter sp.]|nr:helix-turn-helix domain-containing protein [Flavipsychrobacter sp.]
MTTNTNIENDNGCPVEGLLKMLSGKYKMQMFKLAVDGPLRFNALLRDIDGANKQTVAVALKELEEQGLLIRTIIKQKPLHVEYILSEKGQTLIPVFRQLETVLQNQ